MLVSWNWLKRYVDLPMTHDDLVDRLSMTGLNHEGSDTVGGETVIDLEVTSNRGDCLGHLGVAREIAVLYDLTLCRPEPSPTASGPAIEGALRVTNQFVEGCPRYTARIIRGVKVGPSPSWLVDALAAIGIGTVNNVVDVTNFVLMECGQPLHAFDLGKLAGPEIIVRRAADQETIVAIDHRSYTLDGEMCVIADAKRAVAVAGVMGGEDTEVTTDTTDLLIESAVFSPLSVRRTARKLKLGSPSSFRFERRVDPNGVDWASRRCCDLILELAGGIMDAGVIDTDSQPVQRDPIVFRLAQLKRLLGVDIAAAEVRKILAALGCQEQSFGEGVLVMQPPTWRHDLAREVDLIEEVARVWGYEKIPHDTPIPTTASQRRPFDEAVEKVRGVMVSAGISEAMTPSVVRDDLDTLVSPWSDRAPLVTETAMLKGAKTLRRSLIPSLLISRHANQAASGIDAELFEIAHIYIPPDLEHALPDERYCLAGVLSRDYYDAKGVVECLMDRLGIGERLGVVEKPVHGMESRWSVELTLAGQVVGYLGRLCPRVQKELKIATTTTCFELWLSMLVERAQLVPQYRSVSPFPSVTRDLNLVVDEAIRWTDLASSAQAAVGVELTDLEYRETYRDEEKDGRGKKRILMSIQLQSPDRTLTSAEADSLRDQVVEQCRKDHAAALLG